MPKISDVTKTLLLAGEGLLRVAGNGLEAISDMSVYRHAYRVGGSEYVHVLKQGKKIARIQRAAKELRRRGLIEIQKKGRNTAYALTKSGELQMLKYRMRFARPLESGRLCLVSFDIPQQARMTRHALRNFLRASGFTMAHQSSWISECDVFADAAKAFRLAGIQTWVRIFDAKNIVF